MMRYLMMAASVLALAACATPRQDGTAPDRPAYETLAAEKYGEAAEIVMNADESYVLVRDRAPFEAARPLPRVRFFVYDMKAGEVVYEDEVQGEVAWADAHHLNVYLMPGNVQADGRPSGYRLDVRTGTRQPLETGPDD